jgi:hypothetical protein
MLESFAGMDYSINMLSDVNLIKRGGFIGLSIAVADLVILSSPLACLMLFKNRSIFSYLAKLIFYFISALLFGLLIVELAVEVESA